MSWQRNIDALEQTTLSMAALGGELAEADWDRETDCPGWSVKDQFNHVLEVERWLLGEAPPGTKRPTVADMDSMLVPLRERTGAKIVAELRDVAERRAVQLRSGGVDLAEVVDTPFGKRMPYGDFMRHRAFDVWVHEQDVRRAVGRPGNLDGPAAECTAEILGEALPFVVAKRARAAPGQSVAVEAGDRAWKVTVGDDGRARPVADPARATTTLRMGWETFVRLGCGRAGPEQVDVDVDGDKDLAARVLGGMAITP